VTVPTRHARDNSPRGNCVLLPQLLQHSGFRVVKLVSVRHDGCYLALFDDEEPLQLAQTHRGIDGILARAGRRVVDLGSDGVEAPGALFHCRVRAFEGLGQSSVGIRDRAVPGRQRDLPGLNRG
jgi:hypothetical protein